MNRHKFLQWAVSLLVLVGLTACTVTPVTDNTNSEQGTDGSTQVEGSVTTQPDDQNSEESPEDRNMGADVETFKDVLYGEFKELDTEKVLANYKQEVSDLFPEYLKETYKDNYLTEMLHFYDVGDFFEGKYKGQDLVILENSCEGPCFASQLLRFAYDAKSGELTYLSAITFAQDMPDYLSPLTKNEDSSYVLEELDLPKTIMLPGGKDSITLKNRDIGLTFGNSIFSMEFNNVAFVSESYGNIYFGDANTGCLYIKTPDGVVGTYTYDSGLTGSFPSEMIVWEDDSYSTVLEGNYTFKTGGCGIGASCYFVENVDESELEVVGKSSNGLNIYMAKDTSRVETEPTGGMSDMSANGELNLFYDNYMDIRESLSRMAAPSEDYTYQEYLDLKPIIYWKDPFGRFSGLVRVEFRPPAECGKPVIYLYPEQEEVVNVQVDIDEFTVTEPAYPEGEGWTVLAKPNGELINLADGMEYPYLFWEGISSKTLDMNAGFVVEKGELENFLNDSLVELGLNDTEKADFMEFWLAKMQNTPAPYVMVSFVGTSDFNKVAPLTITPAPDTLIRVFMYYQPVWQKLDMPAQKLSAPERVGYTVVEWGGTSSEAWQIK